MKERVFWMVAFDAGARVITTTRFELYDDAVAHARELAQLNPRKRFYIAEARAVLPAGGLSEPVALVGGTPPF